MHFLAKTTLVTILFILIQVVNTGIVTAHHLRRSSPQPAKMPYQIVVDLTNKVTTVYGLDANNQYTIIVRQMISTVGAELTPTIQGEFTIPGPRWGRNINRLRWSRVPTGYYVRYFVRYFVRIHQAYLFHSVLYDDDNISSLNDRVFEELGTKASRGCVRLLPIDARWVFNNIQDGTRVIIKEKDPDPHLTQSLIPRDMTAFAEDALNPLPTTINITVPRTTLRAGETIPIEAIVNFFNGTSKNETDRIEWTTSNPGVLEVTNNTLRAISPGTVTLTARFRSIRTRLTFNVICRNIQLTGIRALAGLTDLTWLDIGCNPL